jgi:metal-responsive CopG/Arc/MetJ family transcriptional regulator
MSRKTGEAETMSQISIKLPKKLIEKYNQYAQSKSNPRSYYMREALVEYMERKEKEIRND